MPETVNVKKETQKIELPVPKDNMLRGVVIAKLHGGAYVSKIGIPGALTIISPRQISPRR